MKLKGTKRLILTHKKGHAQGLLQSFVDLYERKEKYATIVELEPQGPCGSTTGRESIRQFPISNLPVFELKVQPESNLAQDKNP